MDLLTRTFQPVLEVRSTAQGGDGHTVSGIAVPYGQPMRIDATLVEQFARGAFRHQVKAAHRIAFARDHLGLGGTLIGRLSLLREDAAGLYMEARISRTPAGLETLELIRDGALRELSIGFREVHNRTLSDGTVERTRADLREIASVLEGAYGEAAMVESVRHAALDEGHSCPSCGGSPRRLEEAAQILASLPVLPA